MADEMRNDSSDFVGESEDVRGRDENTELPKEDQGLTAEKPDVVEKKETYAFRWEYSEQNIADKSREDQKRYKREKGTLVYAIVMTVAFLVAFAILITSLGLNNLADAVNPAINNTDLSISDIVDIGIPSTFAIFASNGDGSGAMGSGFALTKTGYIMTNYHVVDNATSLLVVDSDYREYAASLVGFDKELDIAVLYAEGASFVPATIGDSNTIRLGGTVVAIGCPNGEELMFSVSNGIVSGLNRVFGDDNAMIQTNAPLNPGNSGGPLFDENGHVIGVVTSKLTSTTVDNGKEIALEGIAFAVPINDAIALADELIKEDLARPMMGVSGIPVEAGKSYFFSNETAYTYFVKEENGVKYYMDIIDGEETRVNITDDMIASGVGVLIDADVSGVAILAVTRGLGADGVLEVGDIVTAVDNTAVSTTGEIKTVFSRFKPGDKVDITYYRDGKKFNAKMTLKTKAEMLEAEQNK